MGILYTWISQVSQYFNIASL